MFGGGFQYLVPEILSQIFLESLPEPAYAHDHDLFGLPVLGPQINDVPLSLGRVCSHWRNVSHRTPRLWTRVELTINDTDHSRIEGVFKAQDSAYATAVRYYMTMSRNHPISIVLMWSRNSIVEPRFPAILMPLLTKELLRHTSRWRSLQLHAPIDVMRSFRAAIRKGTPFLEYLKVCSKQSNSWLRLDCAARLSHVDLSAGAYVLKAPASPLVHMRTLKLTGLQHIDNIITWIEHCPALEELNLDSDLLNFLDQRRVVRERTADRQAVRYGLPRLTSLTISFDGYADMANSAHSILRYLQTPTLKALTLHGDPSYGFPQSMVQTHHQEEFATCLLDFFQQASPALTEFNLLTPLLSSDRVSDLLMLVPGLRHLQLSDDLVTHGIMERLTLLTTPYPHMPYCPSLESCGFEVCGNEGLGDASFLTAVPQIIQMILSRWHTVDVPETRDNDSEQPQVFPPRLKTVAIFCRNASLEKMVEHPSIARCIDEGLELKVIVC